ncbi:unnamed protein product [Parajaminaea phylloscopi]
MHRSTFVSRSLLALLALPMAQAVPLATPKANGGSHLARNADSAAAPLERALQHGLALENQKRDEQQVRDILQAARSLASPEKQDLLVLRDLHKRGILDTLVNALAAILTELLGTDGASARHYRRQLANLGAQTGSLVDQITCLILKLIGINDSSCNSSKRADGDAATADQSVDPAAVREAVAQLVEQVQEFVQSSSSSSSTDAQATDSDNSRRDILVARQGAILGVEGILEVLRQLLDTLLNTLLPLSPRSAAKTTSAARPFGTNCPPPGTPNDGQYRPGCPGYGRRDLSERDLNLVQVLIPAIEALIKQLSSVSGSTPSASSASSASSAFPASKSKTSSDDDDSSSSSDGSADDSSASTPGSLLSSLFESRDLLDGDGFGFVKRQIAEEKRDADVEHVGISEDKAAKVNNILNRIIGELSQKRDLGAGPFNRRTIDSVLDKVWAPSMSRRMVLGAASRSIDNVIEGANRVFAARADFQPVWDEIKQLGNHHFEARESNDDNERRAAAEHAAAESFAPVWTSLRDMVDDAFAHGKKRSNESPKLNVKPFTNAIHRWFNHAVLQKSKRDLDQFRPLANAAGNFAKQQMKEWTAALKKSQQH